MSRFSKLATVYDYIDAHLNEHIQRIQECIRQPSISQTGEGISECADLFAKYYKELGCQEVEVIDVGVTKWGSKGNPIVFGKYQAGAKKTLLVYSMYDTMPIYDAEKWHSPPFEARIVEQPPFKRVIIGRGAVNSKGPEVAFLNALMSIKAVEGELPVNLIFVAEGDEERMSMGLHKFVNEYKEELEIADAVYLHGKQDENGVLIPWNGSEGCVYFELETSGEHWGRGPTAFSVHGLNKRWLDSPAWRHIKMLSTLVSDDGNKVLVEDWYENIEDPTNEDLKLIEDMVRKGYNNPDLIRKRLGANVFINDVTDHKELLKMFYWSTPLNLDGIWGGRIQDPGAGSVLPYKVISKHSCRYVPYQNGDDLVNKIRKHLDKNGFSDVKIRVIGDVPWSKSNYNNPLARAIFRMCKAFNVDYIMQPPVAAGGLGPYWPAYLFARDPLHLPICGGAIGHGGRAHAVDEYYVIDGYKNIYGLDGAEKGCATTLYYFATLPNS
ncbi:MAG: M20/M25/M40 family metallo-hydrolase [Candidatus Hodarchaeota archaeon]